VSGTLDNLESAAAALSAEAPQIGALIAQLRTAVNKGEDVLEGLKNNPLLKGGIPTRAKDDSPGGESRNIEF
jgi:phospholipid/cholesterol/gamma-HCH transport system substrate-binding protein